MNYVKKFIFQWYKNKQIFIQYDKGNLIKKLRNETTIEFNLKTKNNNIINYQYPETKEELENIRNTDNEVFSLYLLYQS